MQTSKRHILSLLVCMTMSQPPSATGEDVDEVQPLWEVSIQSKVDWPPIAAPTKSTKERSAEGREKIAAEPSPTMITERTLQASLAAKLLTISGDELEFVPVLGGEAPVKLPLTAILSLRKARPTVYGRNETAIDGEPTEAQADHRSSTAGHSKGENASTQDSERLVTFRSGSCVPGRLKRVTAQGLVLAFGMNGELTVPFTEILSITPLQSDGKKMGELPPAEGRHVARLTTGEVITGNIAPVSGVRDRLTISSPILSGEFPLALIESMLFPAESDAPRDHPLEEEEENHGRLIVVGFTGGASLTSPTISLSGGMLELEIWKGTPFQVPLNSAESITFIDRAGVHPNGPILLWGQYTDKSDEFSKLQTALEGVGIARETIVMDGDDGIGADFNNALQRTTTFVWGEWENFDEATFDTALSGDRGQSLDELLQTYVRNGGIAIFMGMSGGTAAQFNRLGLGDIKSDGSIGDGSDLELIGVGESLAAATDGEIKAANSTMMYSAPEGGDWSPLLAQPGNPENAAIIGQRIGSGWVFLIGMDFYETSENITRILVELMQFRR